MSDIAKLAGVHASTVSRALAGSPLVEQGMRERILRLAQEHGYVVNSTARNLRLKRTQTLSVVIPLGHEAGQALTDPFFVDMLGHLADEITQRGYGMFLQKILPPMDNWLAKLIAAQRADGIIIIGQSTEHAAIEAASQKYFPLVVWGGHFEQQSYCTVGSDNVAGARLAVEHLLNTGRRSIVFLGDPAIPEIGLRHDGYRLALAHGPHGATEDRIVPAHMTADTAYEAMRSYIRSGRKFDAVFAATDVIAISAMRALAASGIAVPKDVAVVGFDDIPMSAYVHPALTTVRQDLQRGAKTLVDLLLQRIEGADTPSATMSAQLIVRDSSIAAANH
jgi:DNA-binding LacI/PurR family transcriptional regulator